ncbi:hypothetical protein chiPu_0004611 [Chiloscyllium punctatum]|uniref:Uncharacterized protein n=1 Tax=Chiloscyllium punctatum TaxID=137246 RepID=A0A401S728_CHIPU|nr:hypothetical protein [Chiloscyllium punctatum]
MSAHAKTSYVISHKIARTSKPFSDGEFTKECLLDSAELICLEKKEAFENEVLCKSVLKINHVVDVVTKIVNFIRARALNHWQFVALLEENETEHRDIGYHRAVRWLSLGKMLKSVWDRREEIQDFCVKKGNGIPQLSDADWIADLGFAVGVTALTNELNVKLQCKGLFVHEMYNLVKAFMRKLQLL